MTVKEMEERTGLPRARIRFYEKEGLLTPERADNGYRNYGEEDLRLLQKIRLCRRLGCTLEQVKALKEEKLPLEKLLEQRMTSLEDEQEEGERVLALCGRIRTDGARWETLDAEEYLDWMPEPVQPEVPDVRFRIRWRRFLARMLDLALYRTVWLTVLALLFRIGILQRGTGRLPDLLAEGALMLLLEPVFLHRFGTTPGKVLLGLHLTRSDGSCFRWQEGARRTYLVWMLGLGFRLPLVCPFLVALGFFR